MPNRVFKIIDDVTVTSFLNQAQQNFSFLFVIPRSSSVQKFKFRGFTKAFTNFAKYVIAFIFAKFKYFAKQIMYLESPDHVLQNDI